MRLPVLPALMVMVTVSSASAESVNLIANDYKPLLNTKAGRIEMCGLHFSAVITTLDQRPMNVQGSINSSYAAGKYPGMLIKVSVTEARNRELLSRKIYLAHFRVGEVNTNLMQSATGEDGNSILLTTDMQKSGDFFSKFPDLFQEGAWVSISLDRSRGDYTFRLPPVRDAETIKQVSECNAIGLKNLVNELQDR